MAELVYLTGAVYIAVTLARLTFWAVDIIEGRLKMFIVYSADGVPCYRTSDEAEADYLSFCMGGYYI